MKMMLKMVNVKRVVIENNSRVIVNSMVMIRMWVKSVMGEEVGVTWIAIFTVKF